MTVAYGWEYWWYACYRVDHEVYDSAASTLSSLPAGSVERDALRLIYRELCVAVFMDLYERFQYWRPGVSGGSVVCGDGDGEGGMHLFTAIGDGAQRLWATTDVSVRVGKLLFGSRATLHLD